jgi:glycosyltransferase involved in cell wall biosynthesis
MWPQVTAGRGCRDVEEAEVTTRRSHPPELGGRRALVIVPAYNEAEMIPRVVRDLNRHAPWADVLIINDGSRDATVEVARQTSAKVISLPVNLGIGGAVQTGFRYASRHGYDLAFQFDGDGQHRATLLGELATPEIGRASCRERV